MAVTSCALLAGVALTAPAAHATPPTPDACPDPFPVTELEAGMVTTGLTVERGTVPEAFTATILGVVPNGIAPGVDMIIAETESPAINRAGGIWAGMSGSPVYAEDGRLIGAIAYGFSLAPSPIAGITPAAAMYDVLQRPSKVAAAKSAETVKLPTSLRSAVVQSESATTAQAASGMRQLPMPLAVSGLTNNRLAKLSERLHKRIGDVRVVPVGAAPAGSTSSPGDIFPGGNFAASHSYGDLAVSGVGTTTAVCDDRALAFGHPFGWTGTSSMSAHPADAVYVQRDNTAGSFKVATPLGVVGTVDQDRLAAIRARLGKTPATTPVRSKVTVTNPGGGDRDGVTQVTSPELLPELAAFHLMGNMDTTVDGVGRGTSKVRWIVDGERASGAPFKLDVTNRYADLGDISSESIFDTYEHLYHIQENPFEDVTITGVRYHTEVSSEFRRYTLGSVQVRQPDGSYRAVPTNQPLKVVTGSRLNLRVTLEPYRNMGGARQVDLSLVVPAGMAGAWGTVDIVGGPHWYDDEDASDRARNFDQLLADLKGMVPNNAVNATLLVEKDTASGYTSKQTTARKPADEVVVGDRSFEIEVVAAPRGKPAVVDGKTWKLRKSLSSGKPSETFTFGNSTHQQLMCDFNGDGKASPALFRDGKWQVRLSSTSTSTRKFTFGKAGDVAVCGDWSGDGRDKVGVFRKGQWLLRDGITSGAVGWDFTFGSSKGTPVVGDWNGSGIDTVGVFRNGEWRVRNSNSAGTPSHKFTYGKKGDVPVVGDWNRDGRDRPGLYRDGKWYVRNKLTSGSSTKFTYGDKSSRPVVWH